MGSIELALTVLLWLFVAIVALSLLWVVVVMLDDSISSIWRWWKRRQ